MKEEITTLADQIGFEKLFQTPQKHRLEGLIGEEHFEQLFSGFQIPSPFRIAATILRDDLLNFSTSAFTDEKGYSQYIHQALGMQVFSSRSTHVSYSVESETTMGCIISSLSYKLKITKHSFCPLHKHRKTPHSKLFDFVTASLPTVRGIEL